ncbi:capsular polysaccharide biosynthesis protein CapF [Cloacibacillus evryensis]|uniref:capsular polysaccharide biosynthesis protein CapF n=1 Tax=Cloacibacillus evryensis TaxID=508460 RepID=UPI0022E97EAE|nr:capsular polysaccharide biosynthesis protein CapF [Cloacibacillus evryensis]
MEWCETMKILVTGANGFIGKNLIEELKNRGHEVMPYDIDCGERQLEQYASSCEFVFHLAGINRPENQDDFMTGNYGFTSLLLQKLKEQGSKAPIMLSSSIQAELDNPYGKSKKAGEEVIFQYGEETGVTVYVYRFPNVFGKWCRPNYNSAVATFCHNIARDIPIQINEANPTLNLVYIDDLVEELIDAIEGKAHKDEKGYCYVPETYKEKLHDIANLIYTFKESRKELSVPDMSDQFTKKLYSTYLSYLPEDEFSYPLKMNIDDRGSFTEILRTKDRGQTSVNITKPGITKGNHWHHTKNEKFVVVSGKGKISFRKIGTEKVIDYIVSGEKIEVVDIPTGYTHNITNIGDTDLVTLMWVNEPYDPQRPDTFFQEVQKEQ